ncbi:MAG TPA: exonuclease SbcCD subunit D C-terminal domain-containing protein [Saprospiraceae bacterium]|nr:exonuclease SbcCD subunit D C-terminal domain-containing protein [Saprospiraceae bacterium]HMQ82975.1 exonuclease SbcCD subunit D C-terminal domain-containing protein [Saprospiraceae bacterium]
MKIIHTSDWHLGQKLLYNDREEEHRLALDWLLDHIDQTQADGLIIAGDVFDIGNPPNYARRLYYRFLTRLQSTHCRHVLIIGGNHDSPAMLDAPKELLEALNIHVLGAVSEDISDDIIEWKNEAGHVEAILAAVPFLRDRDLHYSVAGEGGVERIERIKAAIKAYYEKIAAVIHQKYGQPTVPIIATGHLYASGADAPPGQDNIYIGDRENIKADQFPALFDYVALGHIHRPQMVGGLHHIRYSGSIIPLSFSETQDDKSVYLLHFEGRQLQNVDVLPIPVFRRLKNIQGSLQQVEESLLQFAQKERAGLTPWIDVLVQTDQLIPQLDQRLADLTADLPIQLLKIRLERRLALQEPTIAMPDLEELQEMEVFKMKCLAYGSPPEEMEELETTFRELQTWMQEMEEDL